MKEHLLSRKAAGALFVGVLIGGSTAGDSEAYVDVPEKFSPGPIDVVEIFEPRYNRCAGERNIAWLPPEHRRERAEECLENRIGRVALVNFVLSEEAAENVADGIEETLARVTDGHREVEVTVVEPTARTWHGYREYAQTKDGCPDMDGVLSAARVADATISGMDSYDMILTALPDANCGEPGEVALGSADIGTSRYADMYNSPTTLPLDPTTDEPEFLFSSYDALEPGSPTPVTVGAHEIGHLMGLGHAARVWNIEGGFYQYRSEQTGELKIDLEDYVTHSFYKSYGQSCNLMGNHCYGGDNDYDLNSIQRHQLRWAERLVDPSTSSHIDLRELAAHFDLMTTDERIARYTLDVPLIVGDDEASLTELVLAPNAMYTGIELMALSDTNDVVNLGILHSTKALGTPSTSEILVGDNKIILHFDALYGVTVSVEVAL